MQWREVDLDTGWWLIPGDVSKNHDPHRVPITSMVLEILVRRARAENADDRYVFSNHRHTCVADRARRRQPSSARAESRSTSARTTCDGPRRRTWAKRVSIAFTSRMS
jgi:integrase